MHKNFDPLSFKQAPLNNRLHPDLASWGTTLKLPNLILLDWWQWMNQRTGRKYKRVQFFVPTFRIYFFHPLRGWERLLWGASFLISPSYKGKNNINDEPIFQTSYIPCTRSHQPIHEQSMPHWDDFVREGASCTKGWRRGRGEESLEEEVGSREVEGQRVEC